MNTVATRAGTSFSTPSPRLRWTLLIDAALAGVSGIILVPAAGPLAGPLGLPASLLLGAAAIFILFAAFVSWLGTRARVYRPLVLNVIALNALWAVNSILLLFTPWVQPTLPGELFVIVQALAVAVAAAAELIALRASGTPSPRAR